MSRLGRIARDSPDEADLYVFVTSKTGKRSEDRLLGKAFLGTVCRNYRSAKVSINRYGIKGKGKTKKNKVLYTAEVIYFSYYYITDKEPTFLLIN